MSNFNHQEATPSNKNIMRAQKSQTTESAQDRNHVPVQGAGSLNTVNNLQSPPKGTGKRTLEEFSMGNHDRENEDGKRQRVELHEPTYANDMSQRPSQANQHMLPGPDSAPRSTVDTPVSITKDLVPPVPELSLSWPLPKVVADPTKRRSIRTSMVWNSQDPHPDNRKMVALRIEHEDLRYVDYSIVDMPILTWLLIQERVHKLNEALTHFMPEELPKLSRTTNPREHMKPVVRWCKEEDSIQLLVNFWDSDTMIETLRPFAETKRDLSIYDVIWLTDYVERRKQNSPVRHTQPIPVVQPPAVQVPQQTGGHPPVSGQPKVPQQQQVTHQPQAPPQPPAPSQAEVPPQPQLHPTSQLPPQTHVPANLPLHQPEPKRPYVPDWLPPFKEGTRINGAEIPVLAHTQEGRNVQPLSDVAKDKSHVVNPTPPPMLSFSKITHVGDSVASTGDQQQRQTPTSSPASSTSTKRKPVDEEQSENIGQANKRQKTQEPPEVGEELFADVRNGKWTYEEMSAALHSGLAQGTVSGPTVPNSESMRDNSGHLAILNQVPQVLGQESLFKVEEGEYYPERFDPQKPEEYQNMLALTEPNVPMRVNPFTLGCNGVRRPQDVDYRALPEVRNVEALNRRLSSVLPRDTRVPQLLGEMPIPPANIISELTRCARFAQSDAQKRVDWRLHPAHVYEIVQRSNYFGLELLISRSDIVVSSPATREELDMAMAMRFAQQLFGKDPITFVAADIPTITAYLEGDIPSAMFLTIAEDDNVFGDFVEELAKRFLEDYPPIDKSGQVAWMNLHSQAKYPNSLQTKVIELILNKISGLGMDVQDEPENSLGEDIYANSQVNENAGTSSFINLESSREVLSLVDDRSENSVTAVDEVLAAHLAKSQASSPVMNTINDQTVVPDVSTVNDIPKAAPMVDDETGNRGTYLPQNDEDTQASVSSHAAVGSGPEDISPQVPQDGDVEGAALHEGGCISQPTASENLQQQPLDVTKAHGQWVMDSAGFGKFAAYPHYQPSDDPSWNEWVQANNRNIFGCGA
ncbi:hypothetical protein TUN199_11082 [Pyrenophora tritici-repentis]|nr:hypothetical protein Alg215_10859 [Pyrenophora tritici-repentis]KAI0616925.1 hypothetical protein TUN199_11082 [Pyrenophora tritici-repentis]KAI1564306.1 hypothetical protein PtrEW7m1_010264 [Pyrenophora tritici-repentis]PWO20459.1 cell wall protein [Pyrenophora tritici-repentis]